MRRRETAVFDGLGSLADAELAQTAAQRAGIETEDSRGAAVAFDDPSRALENAPDVGALPFLQRAIARGGRGKCRCEGGRRRKKLAAVEHSSGRDDHQVDAR